MLHCNKLVYIEPHLFCNGRPFDGRMNEGTKNRTVASNMNATSRSGSHDQYHMITYSNISLDVITQLWQLTLPFG